MPAKNPRINVVLEEPLFKSVKQLAKVDGVSLSLKARDLIREALETHEDETLALLAQSREESLGRKRLLDHDEVW